MKFVEKTSISIPEGAVLKVQIDTMIGTQINWGMIAEDAEGDEVLVLLDLAVVEAIETVENNKIQTTEDTYTIITVYSNPALHLE